MQRVRCAARNPLSPDRTCAPGLVSVCARARTHARLCARMPVPACEHGFDPACEHGYRVRMCAGIVCACLNAWSRCTCMSIRTHGLAGSAVPCDGCDVRAPRVQVARDVASAPHQSRREAHGAARPRHALDGRAACAGNPTPLDPPLLHVVRRHCAGSARAYTSARGSLTRWSSSEQTERRNGRDPGVQCYI